MYVRAGECLDIHTHTYSMYLSIYTHTQSKAITSINQSILKNDLADEKIYKTIVSDRNLRLVHPAFDTRVRSNNNETE